MEVKCLEIRDTGTFIPVICLRPVAENDRQGYLLRRDGYRADETERCIIVIKAQCRGVSYEPYGWPLGSRTMQVAHSYIEGHWADLWDGDVIDVEFILGEAVVKKRSERSEEISRLASGAVVAGVADAPADGGGEGGGDGEKGSFV